MSTAATSFSSAALRTVAVLAVTASVATAAVFEAGNVRLSFSDGDGSSFGRQMDGSVMANAAPESSRATYSIRMKAARSVLERCESGTLYLDYMAVPVYTNRRTGEVVHPKSQFLLGLLREASGAGAEQVQVPFTFDAGGRFEMQDILRPNACFMPDPNVAVNCGIKWSAVARVDCD